MVRLRSCAAPPFVRSVHAPGRRLPACWPAGRGGVRRRKKRQTRRLPSQAQARGCGDNVARSGHRSSASSSTVNCQNPRGTRPLWVCACCSGVLGLEAPGTGGRWGSPLRMTHRATTTTTTPTMPTMPGYGRLSYFSCEKQAAFRLWRSSLQTPLTCDAIPRPAGVIPSSTRHLHPSTSNTNKRKHKHKHQLAGDTSWPVAHVQRRKRWDECKPQAFWWENPGADAADGTRMQGRLSHARLPGSLTCRLDDFLIR